MTAKPASVGEWKTWKITQYEITCSTLSAIIESKPVMKYARNGPWRIAAKDAPVGEVGVVRAMASGYRLRRRQTQSTRRRSLFVVARDEDDRVIAGESGALLDANRQM
jgi:hypothetical protein